MFASFFIHDDSAKITSDLCIKIQRIHEVREHKNKKKSQSNDSMKFDHELLLEMLTLASQLSIQSKLSYSNWNQHSPCRNMYPKSSTGGVWISNWIAHWPCIRIILETFISELLGKKKKPSSPWPVFSLFLRTQWHTTMMESFYKESMVILKVKFHIFKRLSWCLHFFGDSSIMHQ